MCMAELQGNLENESSNSTHPACDHFHLPNLPDTKPTLNQRRLPLLAGPYVMESNAHLDYWIFRGSKASFLTDILGLSLRSRWQNVALLFIHHSQRYAENKAKRFFILIFFAFCANISLTQQISRRFKSTFSLFVFKHLFFFVCNFELVKGGYSRDTSSVKSTVRKGATAELSQHVVHIELHH